MSQVQFSSGTCIIQELSQCDYHKITNQVTRETVWSINQLEHNQTQFNSYHHYFLFISSQFLIHIITMFITSKFTDLYIKLYFGSSN